MFGASFLQDLAVVMLVAGVVTLLFRWLRQPVVLGYLLAGFLIGPYTPPFPLVRDESAIRTLADIGVVFLMFSLGLEFNLRKLRAVGPAAFVTASIEIMLMIAVGYALGSVFGWTPMESVFLGVMLALTSTTIVVKSLRDSGELKSKHGELISGVSLFDDIFVIFAMILLPGFAASGHLPAGQATVALLRLVIFLVAATVAGLILVPRALRLVGRLGNDETLLVTVLGLCLGASLLTVRMGYSPALGAFMAGAMVAESRELGRVLRLTEPLRDMFSAVFFVAIGMMINPAFVRDNIGIVLALTAIYLIAKIAACSLGALMAGYDGRTAVRVGTGMAQIGEFAFILATLGMSLNAIGPHVYPVIVAVASLNALIRPYLTASSDRLADWLASRIPGPVRTMVRLYSGWVGRLQSENTRATAFRMIRGLLWQIALNVALIAACFIVAAVAVRWFDAPFGWLPPWTGGAKTVAWLVAALAALPLYVATVRKMQAMGMMLSELALAGFAGSRSPALRSFLSNALWVVQVLGLGVMTVLVSLALLPPLYVSLVLLAAVLALAILRGPALNAWYTRAKGVLVETWSQPPPEPDEPAPLPAALREAKMEAVVLSARHAAVGRLIRELQLRSLTGASIVAVERAGKTMVNPDPDLELFKDDSVLLLGSSVQIKRARELLERGDLP